MTNTHLEKPVESHSLRVGQIVKLCACRLPGARRVITRRWQAKAAALPKLLHLPALAALCAQNVAYWMFTRTVLATCPSTFNTRSVSPVPRSESGTATLT